MKRVHLLEHIEMRIAFLEEKNRLRIDALGKELAISIKANDVAVNKAETVVNQRLEGMNEFREQLTRQAATFATMEALYATRIQLETSLQSQRDTISAELKHMNSVLVAKLDAQYKIIFTIAGAVAAIQATLTFLT